MKEDGFANRIAIVFTFTIFLPSYTRSCSIGNQFLRVLAARTLLLKPLARSERPFVVRLTSIDVPMRRRFERTSRRF